MSRNLTPDTAKAWRRPGRGLYPFLLAGVRALLFQRTRMTPRDGDAHGLDLVTTRVNGSSKWRREEIYDADGR